MRVNVFHEAACAAAGWLWWLLGHKPAAAEAPPVEMVRRGRFYVTSEIREGVVCYLVRCDRRGRTGEPGWLRSRHGTYWQAFMECERQHGREVAA